MFDCILNILFTFFGIFAFLQHLFVYCIIYLFIILFIKKKQEVLCRYCEIMKLRMPIKHSMTDELSETDTNDFFDDAKSWFYKVFSFAQLDPKKFPPKEYQLAAEFSRDKDYL